MHDDHDAMTAEAGSEERAFEAALRPRSLDELVGQDRVREQLSLVLDAAVASRAMRAASAGL